ncbi:MULTISPECIES: TetR/AcrR family transcriptional regulator [Rhodococcus]|uniref:TetR/AcrR family transcriptional regulator n=1 Tax=Rhodococcus oxybenzonivorans TaxID=1990687 RepID=A0AAE5A8L2_9NOCA|nr:MULTISPECIES: TetR/AcrR family transcriptional regulator [Rhodococcus]MDV7241131.1 TetR/AcrR family transcriptional regulator [Rhodococcus oxybenzonivorans]MDV7266889.1 TetR/AcrR family transcriptional regulator [Rhodococcus oxybenzonivorans]MDV7273404.1 TetR/AcrR family transcriptional regulator [Rhodococcus oxybenzonivorans]MDV7332858.1 TetR/AcrR family transcriptional regulator [Rhodococcus oxybenzonivorans]MDV7342024.1 TetR/AcrR family transcriptional regulator [Rhodococcus oxybenzonivo
MTDTTSPPTRKDAARNRARLLEAAEQLFASEGLDVTLKDVALRAGVGVGTVYRHFPTKDDLLDEIFADRLASATDSARRAAADPDGWRGLVRYLEDSMRTQRDNCGLRGLVIATVPSCPMVVKSRTEIAPLVRQMVAKAQKQGTLRPDFDATDVTYIQVALAAIMEATHDTSPDLYRQHLKLFIDGMRAEGPPGAAFRDT